MSEKRFTLELQNNDIYDKETNTFYCDNDSICNLLNEQQELIEELHISDHMGWGRAEKFEKELKQKKIYIKRLEYKVQKFKEMNGEQQATINHLESDKAIAEDYANLFEKENVKLRKQIGEQQSTIQELERKLKKYAKTGEEQLKQIINLQDELNECRARPTLATDERGVVKVEYR